MKKIMICCALLAVSLAVHAKSDVFKCPAASDSMLVISLDPNNATVVVGPKGDSVAIPGDAAKAGDRIVDLSLDMPKGFVRACLTSGQALPTAQKIVLRLPAN